MSGLHHSVIVEFGVAGSKIAREKGYYTCKTEDYARMIRKTQDTPSQIWARHQIKEHCIRNGYHWVDRNYLTRNGQPYIYADGETYVMTDLLTCPETDFTDPIQLNKVVEAMAQWHKCTRGMIFEGEAAIYKGRPPALLTERYKAQGEAFELIRKRLRKQSQLSDFDVMVIKHYADYHGRILQAQAILNSTKYHEKSLFARANGHICHGGIKEEAMRIQGANIYITKLENSYVDYQLGDLCALILRHEKKGGTMPRTQIIETYAKILPLQPDDEKILQAMLLYPTAFAKIVMEYYNKKRTWIPMAMINRLREILEEQSLE